MAIGFGISKAEHVSHFTKIGFDGIIVGSAFIKIIEKNLNDTKTMLEKVNNLSRELFNATTIN